MSSARMLAPGVPFWGAVRRGGSGAVESDAGQRPASLLRLLAVACLMLGALLGVASAAFAQGGAPGAVPTAPPGLWDRVAEVVVTRWVTIGLLVVGCVLLFIDLLTPLTWGVMGTLGVLAVGLVFAAHITMHTGGWIGIVLLLGGVTFLLLETHVFPGHGIAAVAGLLLTFLGMFWSLGGSQNALFSLSVSAVLTVVTLIAFFAYLPKSPIWKRLGQEMRQHETLGYTTSDNKMFLLGRTGVALTVLRPAGTAEIDGLRVDVVTEGDFIEAGAPVVVTHVEGVRVVVERDVAASSPDRGERSGSGSAREMSATRVA
jgi:Membrane-bound serine protease (ClpP class)